jgi:hypothetical protein
MAALPGAVGLNADRGTDAVTSAANSCSHRPAPGARPVAQRVATWCGTTRSARTSGLPGWRSRRRTATVTDHGGLATTWNGWRGSRRSLTSARTIRVESTSNRRRRVETRVGWSSNATTRAPVATRGAVIAPVPAQMSSTRSPRPTPERSTKRCAQRSVSWWNPHRRVPPAATKHHHHERHGNSLAARLGHRHRIRA